MLEDTDAVGSKSSKNSSGNVDNFLPSGMSETELELADEASILERNSSLEIGSRTSTMSALDAIFSETIDRDEGQYSLS